jgi:hypothetical protein
MLSDARRLAHSVEKGVTYLPRIGHKHDLGRKACSRRTLQGQMNRVGHGSKQITALALEILQCQHQGQVVARQHAVDLDHGLFCDRERLNRATEFFSQFEDSSFGAEHGVVERLASLAPQHKPVHHLVTAYEDVGVAGQLLQLCPLLAARIVKYGRGQMRRADVYNHESSISVIRWEGDVLHRSG